MTTCPATGKLSYPDKRTAKRARANVRFLRRRLACYRCEECGGWHLGHRTAGYWQEAT